MKKALKLVYIEWEDSYTIDKDSWTDRDDFLVSVGKKSLICKSVGWVHKDNKDVIAIASHLTEGQVGGTMVIPHNAIKKIVELEV